MQHVLRYLSWIAGGVSAILALVAILGVGGFLPFSPATNLAAGELFLIAIGCCLALALAGGIVTIVQQSRSFGDGR